MISKSIVVANFAPLDALNLDIENNRGAYVKVGILGDGGHVGRKETGINNPSLGLAHEFGVASHNLPQRSFLRVPLSTELPKRMAALGRDFWQAILDKKGVKGGLRILGGYAEKTVDDAFASGGFGRWPTWSDKYGRHRELEQRMKKRKMNKIGPIPLAILVRTAQLAKSITSAVVGGKKP
jgi:hypothetical protein